MPKSKKSAFAKVTILFAVAFVIGVGLCGLDYVLASNGIGKSTEEFGVGPLDGLSILVMVFSAIGLALTLFVWFIVTVVTRFSKTTSEPQKLFDEKDETKPGDPQ
jgi:cellulose synthase/poly-beta-1,6-N-acetylglucosamine synthase-like glycosyltransferase